MDGKPKLVLMDVGMFCVGMRIQAKIYYLHKGTYVLLCKNVQFSPALIHKLQYISKHTGGIYIEEDDCEEVWNESLRLYSMDSKEHLALYQKVRQEYHRLLSNITCFLGNIAAKQMVDLSASNEITAFILKNLSNADQAMVLRCINMIGAVDDYLYSHSLNVAALNGLMGNWMQLPEAEVKQLIKIGLLHDLGKLQVPTEIIHKPGPLTAEEFEHVKQHPAFTYNMLVNSGEKDEVVLQAVRQHHEKPNGTGYPDGATGKDISLYARVTSVSDVYDAMVSKRCYKEANTPFEILSQFKQNRFSDLDLQLVNLFLDHVIYLFVGMRVKLSNGDCGEVVFVPPNDCANPVVKVGNRVVSTSSNYRCVEVEE